MQRPVGFGPEEISALVNRDVVTQHVAEAAFLWRLRNRAVTEPHYSLKDLAALDRRLEANLAGLRVAGDLGWNLCRAALEQDGPGEVFALTVLAFASRDRGRMRDALYAGCFEPHLRTGLVSALGWHEHAVVAPWLSAMLESRTAEHRIAAIAASAIHRQDPGKALAAAILDGDILLSARALRAVGELKRVDLIGLVHARLGDDAPAVRFWAAWSLLLVGDRDGLSILMAFAEETGLHTFASMQLGLRMMAPEQARDWIRALAGRQDASRLTVLATGIFGDPASIPWLIRVMEDPQLSRLAGEAFTSITGIDLAYNDLVQTDSPPLGHDAPADPLLPAGYEANLQWPSTALVSMWWRQNAPRYATGQRYLGGQPVTRTAAVAVLLNGKQRQRTAAALELACIDPRQVLVEARERGDRQQRRFAKWTS